MHHVSGLIKCFLSENGQTMCILNTLIDFYSLAHYLSENNNNFLGEYMKLGCNKINKDQRSRVLVKTYLHKHSPLYVYDLSINCLFYMKIISNAIYFTHNS